MGTPRAKALRQEHTGTLQEQNEGQRGYRVAWEQNRGRDDVGMLERGQIQEDMGRKFGFFSMSLLVLVWSKSTTSPGSLLAMQSPHPRSTELQPGF